MKWKKLFLTLFVVVLAACSADAPTEAVEPEVAAPAIVEEPTAAVVAEETAVPPTPIPPTDVPVVEEEPEASDEASAAEEVEAVVEAEAPEAEVEVEEEPEAASSEETAVNVIAGRTPDGAFFLGDPNAPLTMIDYSDFL